MKEKNIQEQIDEINGKLDLLLENMMEQRRNRQASEDLVDDLYLVAKDAYNTAVVELDQNNVELDTGHVKHLMLKAVKNIDNFVWLFETLESFVDLIKDLSPIINEIGIDAIRKFNDFDQKGYFEYLSELGKVVKKIKEHYTIEDIRQLSENIPVIVQVLRNLANPELITTVEKATKFLSENRPDEQIDRKSWFKLARDANSKEVRKTVSYSMRLLNAISKENGK